MSRTADDPCEQRVNDATAACEAHWRSVLLDRDSTIAQLRSTENMYRTLAAILKDENEELEKEIERLRKQ